MPIRVLIAKPGVDGHYRGGVVIARALRDAGMEVIYGGQLNAQEIVEAAINEDVDVIGLSVHSGAYFAYARKVLDLLANRGIKDDVLLVMGGAIPVQDFGELEKMGVAGSFGPGTDPKDVVDFINQNVQV